MSEHGPAMPVSVENWKPLRKGSLCGFVTVRVGRALKVKDVTVHNQNGRKWAMFPAKPMLDKDGAVQRDERGKIRYVPLLEWSDRGSADRFSDSVIAALEAHAPGCTNAA